MPTTAFPGSKTSRPNDRDLAINDNAPLSKRMDLKAQDLRILAEGIDAQFHEAQAFRGKCGELKAAIDELRETVKLYQRNLANIRTNPLHRRARRLARIAENWSALE